MNEIKVACEPPCQASGQHMQGPKADLSRTAAPEREVGTCPGLFLSSTSIDLVSESDVVAEVREDEFEDYDAVRSA